MTNSRITAPMVALMIDPMKPPPIAMPRRGKSHPAMNAPTIPTMISPISPNPAPRTISPASQPATAPTIRTMTIASTLMMSLPVRRAMAAPVRGPKAYRLCRRLSAALGPAFNNPHQVGHDAVQLEILGRIDRGDTGLLQLFGVLRRNDAADHDRHVVDAGLLQPAQHVLDQGHMAAREDR